MGPGRAKTLEEIALAQQLMGDRFRGCGWFVFVDLINVVILIAFPQHDDRLGYDNRQKRSSSPRSANA
jgi:hypothetical protein